MVEAQTTQGNLAEYSRCDDPSWLSVEESNVDHKSDASIAEKVGRALWDIGELRSTSNLEIGVAVKDGVVFLSGNVISTGNQRKAEDAARTIPGVLGVKNYLVADDQLIREVAGALGKIEHAYGVKFFTGAQNGVIRLHGEVSSVKVRLLAEKCAANIAGVRGVIDHMRSPVVDEIKEDQRFLQPSVGELFYFRDSLSGTVHKVIMNPNNRRVIAMIVRGRYPNSLQDSKSLEYGVPSVPERLIVIPVSAIRLLTKSSGFLHIDSAEAARYTDFEPSGFTAPRKDWTPPYPYCPDDILFPLESDGNIDLTEGEPAIVDAGVLWAQPTIHSGILE